MKAVPKELLKCVLERKKGGNILPCGCVKAMSGTDIVQSEWNRGNPSSLDEGFLFIWDFIIER